MKRQMEDMVTSEKRTIRHIPLNKKEHSSFEPRSDRDPNDLLPPKPPRTRRFSYGKWIFLGLIILVLLFFILSVAFRGAIVAVEPHIEEVTINGEFVAQQSATGTSPSVLPFETITITRTESRTVPATGEEEVDTQASGRITVFNDFDAEPQLLVENTRFETPEGLIYRIQDAVTVPGQTTNEDGETVPGSLTVTVYADAAGEEYNIDRTDFTIPGLEGDPRYFDFYARSETSMTGGFSGVQRIVDEETEEAERNEMQTALTTALREQIGGEVPEEVVFFPEFTSVSFRALGQEPAETNNEVVIREEGTMTAAVFNAGALSAFIAEQTIAAYNDAPVLFTPIDALEAMLTEEADVAASDTLSLSLSGEGTLIYQFDEARLKADLAGKSRGDIDTVLSGYPAIERARITLRPFWTSQFPDNVEEIEIRREIN